MHRRTWRTIASILLTVFAADVASTVAATQAEGLKAVEGEWLFVEDRTEGRPIEQGGAPMSMRFRLRVEEDAVVYPRPRGDERITLDGSVIEKTEENGSISRYSGQWVKGRLEYTLERLRKDEKKPYYVLKRVFRPTEEGLLIDVVSNGSKQVALYQHPEKIPLPEPAKATIADLAWLTGAWTGTKRTSSVEERWSPPKGGAMLGVARTVRREKMVGFEFLRIVERDGGLVYVAQPGGRPPTEFVLAKLDQQRAEFVNPRYGYPQRIVYELSREGVLTASIGFARGRLQGTEFKAESK